MKKTRSTFRRKRARANVPYTPPASSKILLSLAETPFMQKLKFLADLKNLVRFEAAEKQKRNQ